MRNSRIHEVKECINRAVNDGLVKDLELKGATGKKVLAVLQHCVNLLTPDECYLEIGVYRGLSLISTSSVRQDISTFGIDNFTQFDQDGTNRLFIENTIQSMSLQNTTLINLDFEDALHQLDYYLQGKKIGIFFIDGPHDYRSQLVCLLMSKKYLSDQAIIVVDNSNYNHVRQANQDFLYSHPDFKLLFEGYTKSHPANLKGDDLNHAWDTWLDGINVIVRDPYNELRPMYPPTIRDRALFFADHRIHPMRNSVMAWRAAKIPAVIKPFKPFLFFAFLAKLFIETRKRNRDDIEPWMFINSHSQDLPFYNMNNFVSNDKS
ncbi:MAG: class I SAM-dependent methyltransferase [Candidatus Competibacteraceae bacterium]|nr:class I SAM-dependent methyltransferase [Candidatus Competibacteraceae bacterium]